MIAYTLPGLLEFDDINMFFIEFSCRNPDTVLDDVAIASVYGGFPGSRLCGGRNNPGTPLPLDSIARQIARYNELNVACNATFSNQFATPKMVMEDGYERQLLRILGRYVANGVIAYSDDFAEAVRDEFPTLRLIASTTKGLTTVEDIKETLFLYDRLVLDYNLTKNEDFIADLAQPEKIEIMVNEYCTLNCPFRAEHYKEISHAQLLGVQAEFPCRHDPAPQAFGFLQGLINGDVFLRNEDIRRYTSAYGIESFKIVGRGLTRFDIVDSYLYYLMQPDCWNDILGFLTCHGYF